MGGPLCYHCGTRSMAMQGGVCASSYSPVQASTQSICRLFLPRTPPRSLSCSRGNRLPWSLVALAQWQCPRSALPVCLHAFLCVRVCIHGRTYTEDVLTSPLPSPSPLSLQVHNGGGKTIVFTATKKDADEVALTLGRALGCEALHGDIAQAQRERTLQVRERGWLVSRCAEV